MPLGGESAALRLELDDGVSRSLFAERLPAGSRVTSRVLFSRTRVRFGFRTDSLRAGAVAAGTAVGAGWVSELCRGGAGAGESAAGCAPESGGAGAGSGAI